MDIQGAIKTEIDNYIGSKKFNEMVKQQAETMVDEAVKSCFRGYNGLSEDIENAVKESFSFDIKELGLSVYSKVICDIVKTSLEAKMIGEPIQEEINKVINEITAPMGKTIKFDEILKKLILTNYDFDHYETIDEFFIDHSFSDYFTVIIERPSGNSDIYDWIEIYMSEKPRIEKYDCEFRLFVHKDFTSLKINGRDIKPHQKLFSSYMNPLEKLMYKMFLNNVHIDRLSVEAWEDRF